MFAVPGWAVSASALIQEQSRSKKSVNNAELTPPSDKSKKRKRNEETAEAHARDARTASSSSRQEEGSVIRTSKPAQNERNRTVKGRRHDKQSSQLQMQTQTKTQVGQGDEHPPPTKRSSGEKTKNHENSDRTNVQERTGLHRNAVGRTPAAIAIPQPASTSDLTPLQAKMRSKLTSARFRHLNQTLYTTRSDEALQLFSSSPDLFTDYHAGFAQQVKDSWPQNPVDDYVQTIKVRGTLGETKQNTAPLPRRKTGSCTIADLGCGDAPLARGCQSVIKTLKLKFHNYDLHAPNSLVTKADISNLPLRDGEADIAVFCLSLMGTNWIEFVEEAWRILRGDGKGEVWVAEVKSRFGRVTKGRVVENSVGKRRKKQGPRNPNGDNNDDYDGPEQFVEDGRTEDQPDDETDISAFVKVFTRRGFQLRDDSVKKRNKMFVSMIFTKTGIPTAGKHKGLKWTGKEYQKQLDGKTRFAGGQNDDEITPEQEAKVLKPCVYKTR